MSPLEYVLNELGVLECSKVASARTGMSLSEWVYHSLRDASLMAVDSEPPKGPSDALAFFRHIASMIPVEESGSAVRRR